MIATLVLAASGGSDSGGSDERWCRRVIATVAVVAIGGLVTIVVVVNCGSDSGGIGVLRWH